MRRSLVPLLALLLVVGAGCGGDEPTQVAAVVDTDGAAVDAASATPATEVGGEAGGAVEPPTATAPDVPAETPPPTTAAEVFVPIGEAVHHPAVMAFCDRIAVFAVTIGTMGPDFDAAELVAIEAGADDLALAATELAMEAATIDASSVRRLTECTAELQASVDGL